MLEKNPKKRYTASKIKNHKFFQSINWDEVRMGLNEVTFVPDLQGPEDLKHIDPEFKN